MQVLGRVQLVLGLISFLGVIVILIVLLARGEEAGYSIVISMVILVSTVPVGEYPTDTLLSWGDLDLRPTSNCSLK